MTSPDEVLRRQFDVLRRAERVDAIAFDDLTRRTRRYRLRALVLPVATIGAAAILLLFDSRRPPVPVSLETVSRWRPASDVLLSATGSALGEVPQLDSSVLDAFLVPVRPPRGSR